MKTALRELTVREVSEGYVYNELSAKGLYGHAIELAYQKVFIRQGGVANGLA